ncbi:MAG: hypothetical protein J6C99_03210 [Lachnospiraceae bacterium]|nr:hypothetical protein [Lachnospiraceae bacterium]
MKIREFLRLRRQQDAVKIIILYVIAIGVCCGFLIRDGLRYAQITRTKEEFKLIGNDQVLTDSKVQRVREIEGVTDVSYDVSDSVTVSYQVNTTSFEAELLSEAYIQEVYGITQEGSTTTYYANTAAYKQICQSLSQDVTPIQTDEITVSYTSSIADSHRTDSATGDDGIVSQSENSLTARIIQTDIGGDVPFICAIGDPVTLKKTRNLRIQVARQDQNQRVLTLASNLSFSNDNTLEIYQTQAKLDQLFIQIKFELLLIITCLIAAISLRRYAIRGCKKTSLKEK